MNTSQPPEKLVNLTKTLNNVAVKNAKPANSEQEIVKFQS